jgi:hypothetical protein
MDSDSDIDSITTVLILKKIHAIDTSFRSLAFFGNTVNMERIKPKLAAFSKDLDTILFFLDDMSDSLRR